jgi:hypothetical protein
MEERKKRRNGRAARKDFQAVKLRYLLAAV